MKEKEEIKTQRGIFNQPGNMAFPDDKVLQIFTKLRRKANAMDTKSQSPVGPGGDGKSIRDIEPNFAELQERSMNSYRLHSDVIKTENGFEIE